MTKSKHPKFAKKVKDAFVNQIEGTLSVLHEPNGLMKVSYLACSCKTIHLLPTLNETSGALNVIEPVSNSTESGKSETIFISGTYSSIAELCNVITNALYKNHREYLNKEYIRSNMEGKSIKINDVIFKVICDIIRDKHGVTE